MKDASRLTLDERVGQLFFLGFPGSEPDEEVRELLDRIRPGGIVLSRRNIAAFDQLVHLTWRLGQNLDIAPFIAIGQEGGPLDCLKHLFAPLPSMSEVGAAGATQLRLLARILASELEAAGFNMNFGPVLDLAVPGAIIGDRSLSASAAEVARLARAFLEEMAGRSILACAKHFPGLGSAQRDPHFALPRIDRARKLILAEDMLPFSQLAASLPMIMVSNAYYPGLSDEAPVPACFSPRIVEGLLRRRCGFPGVIVTDDMTMGAVTSLGLTPDLFLRAFEAGNDMMLFSSTTPLVERAFSAFVREARTSPALRARIDGAVSRIVGLKQQIPPSAFHPARPSLIRGRVLRQIDRLGRGLAARTRRAGAAGPSGAVLP